MRLDKFISHTASLSRRDACRAISAGRVTVNGVTASEPSQKTLEDDCITLDGVRLIYKRYTYIMLNKPAGYITATEDSRPGERVITELLPDSLKRLNLFPVGRLDRDTTGLLLLTNDGDACHRALSPKRHVAKSYRFSYSGAPLDKAAIQALCSGVDIGLRDNAGRVILTAPAVIESDVITVTEGKFHQIKRMFSAIGREITALERISFSGIELEKTLPRGGWRYLTADETELFTRDR